MSASKKESHPQQRHKPITEDTILKVSKEIVVKFIEVGRLAPSNFSETFQDVYKAVRETVRSEK